FSRGNGESVMRTGLRPGLLRIDGVLLAEDDAVVDAVFDVRGAVGDAEDPLGVRFVLRKQQGDIASAGEVSLTQLGIDRLDDALPFVPRNLLEDRPVGDSLPRPLIAEPKC